MDNQEKASFSKDNVNEQIGRAKDQAGHAAEIKASAEVSDQENLLSGLSQTELQEAAEAGRQNLDGLGNDLQTSERGEKNSGLSDKERLEAAEADGIISDENKGALSDSERREAADESW